MRTPRLVLMLGVCALAVACHSSPRLAANVVAGSHGDGVSREGAGVRDWHLYPAIVELTGTPEIDAIGDLHGDPTVAVHVLTAAGLIAPNPGALQPTFGPEVRTF